MVAVNNPADLKRRLVAQGFRVEDKLDGTGWTVKAPEDTDLSQLTNPSGIVQVHTLGLRDEGHKFQSIENELKRIGYDPNWEPSHEDKLPNGEKATPTLEEQTGLEVYNKEPLPERDPNDRWVTYHEAAEAIGIGASGIAQRVKAGKLRSARLPVKLNGPYGTPRNAQVLHVNLAETIASGAKGHRTQPRISIGERKPGAAVRTPTPTQPTVRSRYEDSSVGRLKEASVKLLAAGKKIDQGMAELTDAAGVIGREVDAALSELHSTKKRLRDIEVWLERGVSKL